MKTRTVILFLGSLFFTTSSFAVKNFVYCSEGSPSTFNPQAATDGTSFNASSRTVYNRLVDFKTGSTDIVPSLAESWTVSKDGLHYVFQLRKNVSFHSNKIFKPTRPMNADDVIYSFEVQKTPQHPLAMPQANFEYFQSMEMGTLIREIKKQDPYKVEFVLTRPEAPFLANLAMDFASILSKEYAEFLKANGHSLAMLGTDPIGTGPFIFKSYQKDTLIRFTANENYFAGVPKIAQLVFAITPDASVRLQKLKTGECQFIAEPAPQDIETISKTKNLRLMEREGLNVGYIAFNTEKKPFDDIRVRQAIMLALNRESYIQAIYLGRAKVATNPIPPTMWSYNKKIPEVKPDIAQAQKLLAQAGYKNGFETELWTLPVSRPYNPSGKKMGEMMQSDLAKIGIKVKLVSYDWPTYLEKARQGAHQLLQIGWTGDNGDPDNFLNVLLGCAAVKSGANYSRWCYKPFDDIVTQAKQVVSQKARADLYQKAQVIFQEQLPWVPLAHAKVYRAMASGVKGYTIHPFGADVFTQVDFE